MSRTEKYAAKLAGLHSGFIGPPLSRTEVYLDESGIQTNKIRRENRIMSMNIMQLIEQQAKKNPGALTTPRGQSLVNVLQSGNEQQGIEAANNILQSMGLSREEGIAQAKAFFGIR